MTLRLLHALHQFTPAAFRSRRQLRKAAVQVKTREEVKLSRMDVYLHRQVLLACVSMMRRTTLISAGVLDLPDEERVQAMAEVKSQDLLDSMRTSQELSEEITRLGGSRTPAKVKLSQAERNAFLDQMIKDVKAL